MTDRRGEPGPLRARVLVGSLLVVVLGSSAAATVLAVANDRASLSGSAGPLEPIVLYAVVGALVALRRPDNAMGWVFLAIGALWTTGRLADEYSQYGLVTNPGSLPGAVAGVWYAEWYWIPALFLTFVVSLLLFPSGRLPSRRWRPLLWFALASCAVSTVMASLERELELVSGDLAVRNPIAVMPFDDVEDLGEFPPLLVFVCAIGALASVVVRSRRARGQECQQLKWVAYAATVLVLGFIAMGVLDGAFNRRVPVLDGLLLAVVPVAAGVAILRYRLYDIDRIINRTLVYASLTAALGLAYVAVVAGASSLAGQSDLTIAAATLAVAALFQPLRARIQGFIDRRFYRSRYDAALTVEAFSTRLRDSVELNAMTGELLGVVRETLQPAHASLWMRSTEESAEGSA